MHHRGIIQDSDDEDDSFSPVKSPCAGPIDSAQGGPDASIASTTRSTDPAYFENVYAEQKQQATPDIAPDTFISEAASVEVVEESFLRPGSSRGETNSHNPSSLTDPVVASHRKRVARAKEFESITQVTTPGKKSSAPVDPYAIPSSPPGEPGSGMKSKITKTYGKRKKSQRLTPVHKSLQSVDEDHVAETYQHDESSPGPAKRRRISDGYPSVDQATEDVDLVLVPRTDYANASSEPRFQSKGISSSVVYDTMKTVSETTNGQSGASFYIAQSRMSTSQKRQYQPIEFSSDEVPEGNGKTHLTKSIASQVEQRSSDDATIAYSTPSRFGSSHAPLPPAHQPSEEVAPSASLSSSIKKRPVTGAAQEPPSSPDILTGCSPHHKRARRRQNNTPQQATSGESSFPSEATGKRRKQQSPVQDISRNTEELELPLERYNPRPSRRRSAAATLPDTQLPDTLFQEAEDAEKQDDEPILVSSGQASINHAPPMPDPSIAKRRGRKKQTTEISKVAKKQQQTLETSEADSQALTVDTPAPVKRKKGRPKKGGKPLPSREGEHSAEERNEDMMEHTKNVGDTVESSGGSPSIKDTGVPAPTSPEQDTLQDDPPIQRGRGKKREAKATLDSLEPTTTLEKEILKDISNIATPSQASSSTNENNEKHAVMPSDKKEMNVQEASEKGANVPNIKMAVANSQLNKVTYRVGLSKRSRIAPLLKSLRK